MNIGRGKRNTRKVPYAEASAGSVKLLSFHKGGQKPAQIIIYGVNKMTKEELVNAIAELTVLELSELVKAIEEKFGVKAAAPAVAVAAAAPAAAAAAEEKDEFNVVLTAVDAAKKIAVIKDVREITGLGLKEA